MGLEFGYPRLMKNANREQRGRLKLLRAVQEGDAVECKRLAKRYQIRLDEWGEPLRIACEHGLKAVVRVLLDRGASIDQANNNGTTPLFIACAKGHEAVVRVLCEHGADTNAESASRCTALDVVKHDDAATRAAILQYGGRVGSRAIER